MHKHLCKYWTLLLIAFTFSINAQISSSSLTLYKSEVDKKLTIKKITILPFTDNLQGIYSRPVEKHLSEFFEKNHHWEFKEATSLGPILTPDEITESKEKRIELSQSLKSDGYFVGQIIKGPNGIHLKISFFLTSDAELFASESLKGIKRFEVEEIKAKSIELAKKILKKIPYDGLILSRQGNRVTINLGKNDGINNNEIVNVIQVLKAKRHPKFKFIVGTEKEILGKVKLLKVDDTLSFGQIVTEKERGVIRPNAKVASANFVSYAVTSLNNKESDRDNLNQRGDSKISFGKNPISWLPQKPPTFGKVGVSVGLGSYNGNVNTTSNLATKAPLYPSINFFGELWLTPFWSIHAQMRQGILTVDNPSGGSPSTLSQSLTSTDLLLGYNVRLSSSVWGPKIEVLGGFSNYKLFVDDTSVAGLTTKTYSGLKLGLKGKYPVTKDEKWNLGANLFILFSPKLKESPSSSGTSDNTIQQFGGFVDYKLNVNLLVRGQVDLEIYSSNFTGSSITSSSQKHTTLSGGIFYLF